MDVKYQFEILIQLQFTLYWPSASVTKLSDDSSSKRSARFCESIWSSGKYSSEGCQEIRPSALDPIIEPQDRSYLPAKRTETAVFQRGHQYGKGVRKCWSLPEEDNEC